MEQYQGKSVFGGVAIGRIHVFSKGQQQVKRIKVQEVVVTFDGEDEDAAYTKVSAFLEENM